MKKLLLLFISLTQIAFNSYPQTNVSGFILTNTNWNLGGSPYHVIWNTLVVNGATLTIDPGVMIKFDTGKVLQIDGELIAIGTPQNRITFTSSQTIPHAGDWGKIHFSDTCVDAVYDTLGNYVSGSIMKYCDVLYAGGIGFGAIHNESSSPYISQCNIAYSSTAGIYCNGATSLIDSSMMNDCNGYGLYLINYFVHSNSLFILNDTFKNNLSGGFYTTSNSSNNIYCPTCPFLIKNCAFISNANNGAIFTDCNYSYGIHLSENYFESNSTTSGNGIVYISAVNYIIECNRFINNSPRNRGTLQIFDSQSSSAYIRNNIFDGNVSPNSGVSVLHITLNNNPNTPSIINITNNRIENNITTNNSTCYFHAYPDNNPVALFNISNNDIINNQANKTFEFTTQASQNNINLNYVYIKHNNINNPSVQYELYNNIPYGDPNTYADSNYWGGLSTQHIDSVIYDFFDYGNLSVVYYLPILTSPVLIDTTCPINITTGIVLNKFQTTSPLSLFPSPTASTFTIKIENHKATPILYSISNVVGEVIQEGAIPTSSQPQVLIPLTITSPAGVYFVNVRVGEESYNQKVIITH